MLHLERFIIFAVCCLPLLGAVQFRCDYKFTELGWFKYHEIPATWPDARLRCHFEGGMLASPSSTPMKTMLLRSIRYRDIFTGIHASFSKGNFYTIDGIPLDDIPKEWAENEPDNKNDEERCISMSKLGKISDVRCEDPRPYICYKRYTDNNVNVCGTSDPEYRIDLRTNKCYKLHTNPRNYARAHFVCSAEGGHLAIINSQLEWTVLQDIFRKYPANDILGTFFSKDGAFLGFNNWGESSDWRTLEGQSLQEAGFAKFAEGQPDNYTTGQYCGSMYRNGLLDDNWCEEHYPFFCEKKPDYPQICDSH